MKSLLIVAALVGSNFQPVQSFLVESCEETKNIPVVVESYKDAFGPDTILYCKDESRREIMMARVTGYAAEPGKKGAIGKSIVPGGTAAVSRNCAHLLGKKIYVDQHGVYEVNDLTAKWIQEKFQVCTVDLARASEEEAQKVGNKQRKIVVLD